jgi:hypothetical protein
MHTSQTQLKRPPRIGSILHCAIQSSSWVTLISKTRFQNHLGARHSISEELKGGSAIAGKDCHEHQIICPRLAVSSLFSILIVSLSNSLDSPQSVKWMVFPHLPRPINKLAGLINISVKKVFRIDTLERADKLISQH